VEGKTENVEAVRRGMARLRKKLVAALRMSLGQKKKIVDKG